MMNPEQEMMLLLFSSLEKKKNLPICFMNCTIIIKSCSRFGSFKLSCPFSHR